VPAREKREGRGPAYLSLSTTTKGDTHAFRIKYGRRKITAYSKFFLVHKGQEGGGRVVSESRERRTACSLEGATGGTEGKGRRFLYGKGEDVHRIPEKEEILLHD